MTADTISQAAHILTQITHDHMQSHPTRLMILVAGPYRSGTGDDPAKLAANVAAMEAFAMPLFRAGHVPLVGEWLGLPLATLAGSVRIGDAAVEEVFHPLAERILERCDALLRVGGPPAGAGRLGLGCGAAGVGGQLAPP